jgi:hypothetical protein
MTAVCERTLQEAPQDPANLIHKYVYEKTLLLHYVHTRRKIQNRATGGTRNSTRNSIAKSVAVLDLELRRRPEDEKEIGKRGERDKADERARDGKRNGSNERLRTKEVTSKRDDSSQDSSSTANNSVT